MSGAGVDDFVDSLRLLEQAFVLGVQDGLYRTARYAAQHARGTVRFKNRTGDLRRSISFGMRDLFSSYARASAPYAKFVEDGTRPHEIHAKRGRFLRFEVGGRVFFRRSVMHPGTRPRPFMGDAYVDALDTMPDILTRAIDERMQAVT